MFQVKMQEMSKLTREEKNKRISQGLKKYYDKLCSNIPYEKLSYKRRKSILWKEQNYKCNRCGFSELDEFKGPYQIHHIDGNNTTRKRENEELLCLNCHYITDSYGFKNREHTKQTKIKLQKAALKQHKENKTLLLKDKVSNGSKAVVAKRSPKP